MADAPLNWLDIDLFDFTGSGPRFVVAGEHDGTFTIMDQLPDLAWYEAAVREGGAVLMVRVRGDDRKAAVLRAAREAGGHFANYYGRFATEELLRWSGPEPAIGDHLKR